MGGCKASPDRGAGGKVERRMLPTSSARRSVRKILQITFPAAPNELERFSRRIVAARCAISGNRRSLKVGRTVGLLGRTNRSHLPWS
jgi:hypothetical protein